MGKKGPKAVNIYHKIGKKDYGDSLLAGSPFKNNKVSRNQKKIAKAQSRIDRAVGKAEYKAHVAQSKANTLREQAGIGGEQTFPGSGSSKTTDPSPRMEGGNQRRGGNYPNDLIADQSPQIPDPKPQDPQKAPPQQYDPVTPPSTEPKEYDPVTPPSTEPKVTQDTEAVEMRAKAVPFKWLQFLPLMQKAAKKGKAIVHGGPDDLDKIEKM